MIKVGINGYGTIGKRVAEAVTLQDDMEIVGIVKTKPTYEIRGALDANYPVFTSTKNKVSFFEAYGVDVSGVTENLVDIADIIIAKQRHGPIGTIKMHFDANFTRFSDLSSEEYDNIIE